MSTYTKEEIKDLMRDVLLEREDEKMDRKYEKNWRDRISTFYFSIMCIICLMALTAYIRINFPELTIW